MSPFIQRTLIFLVYYLLDYEDVRAALPLYIAINNVIQVPAQEISYSKEYFLLIATHRRDLSAKLLMSNTGNSIAESE